MSRCLILVVLTIQPMAGQGDKCRHPPDLYGRYHKSPLYTVLVGLCLVCFIQELRANLVHLPQTPILYFKFVFAMLWQRIYFLALLPGYLTKYK